LSKFPPLVKVTSYLTRAAIFASIKLEYYSLSVLWVRFLYYVDTSCKWGTHVLRFFWRTYCSAYSAPPQ
jgi:hypothetical protein